MQKSVLLIGLLLVGGCAVGPVRYKTLGYREFATINFTKQATPIVKPVAAIGGVLTDTGIIIADTIATPVVTIPLAFEGMGPDPQPTSDRNIWTKIITAPIWFPFSYAAYCGFLQFSPEEVYKKFFD